MANQKPRGERFNTQPPEGGWATRISTCFQTVRFNTQPPEGGWGRLFGKRIAETVSTRSRPKAAGWPLSEQRRPKSFQHAAARRRLADYFGDDSQPEAFQHAAARRRLVNSDQSRAKGRLFQHAAARRRLEAMSLRERRRQGFQHAAARRRLVIRVGSTCQRCDVSTRSRPKAAGAVRNKSQGRHLGFNTQPPEGGWIHINNSSNCLVEFQHAAARRRLVLRGDQVVIVFRVSTRSRPKAAGAHS